MALTRIDRLAVNTELIAYIIDGESGFRYCFGDGHDVEKVPALDGEGMAIFMIPSQGGVIVTRDPDEVEAVRRFVAKLPDTPASPPLVEVIPPAELPAARPPKGAGVKKP